LAGEGIFDLLDADVEVGDLVLGKNAILCSVASQ